MKKLIIILSIVIAVFAMGFYLRIKSQSNLKVTTNTQVPVTSNSQITLSEISNHSTSQDCWMAIGGSVYDVTKFIPEHPGEDQILLGCGKDATQMFNNRPADGGSHSNRARNLLNQFQIGNLVN